MPIKKIPAGLETSTRINKALEELKMKPGMVVAGPVMPAPDNSEIAREMSLLEDVTRGLEDQIANLIEKLLPVMPMESDNMKHQDVFPTKIQKDTPQSALGKEIMHIRERLLIANDALVTILRDLRI